MPSAFKDIREGLYVGADTWALNHLVPAFHCIGIGTRTSFVLKDYIDGNELIVGVQLSGVPDVGDFVVTRPVVVGSAIRARHQKKFVRLKANSFAVAGVLDKRIRGKLSYFPEMLDSSVLELRIVRITDGSIVIRYGGVLQFSNGRKLGIVEKERAFEKSVVKEFRRSDSDGNKE